MPNPKRLLKLIGLGLVLLGAILYPFPGSKQAGSYMLAAGFLVLVAVVIGERWRGK